MKRWTDDEIGQLEVLMTDHTNAEIAEILGRSYLSVKSTRHRIISGKVSLDGNNQPWSDAEIDIVRQTRHFTAKQVAESMGDRSYASVNKIRQLLTKTEGIDFHNKHDKDPFTVGMRRLLAKTCIGCGLLLDAKWFCRIRGGRNWHPRCTRCMPRGESVRGRKLAPAARQGSKAGQRRRQSYTRERASRHRFPWIEDDHVILRDSTLTTFEKAIKLGRTLHATQGVIYREGYRSMPSKGDPMQGVWHINNPNEELAKSA